MPLVKQKLLAIAAILTTALVWGLMWYPFRALNERGVSIAQTSLLVYLIAAMLGIALFFDVYRRQLRWHPVLPLLALLFGWCNFSYTWAVSEGMVMRVLLLFYLSPLWTALFSRLLLQEKLTRTGWLLVGLSLAGCLIILYRPGLLEGAALLSQRYEWLALSGGISFALGNVLSKRARNLPVPVKSATIWFGVALMGLIALASRQQLGAVLDTSLPAWLLLALLGMTLLATSIISQHGVSLLPASQAMTLMLLELVFAALSAYWLAGERMSLQEWLGGALIAAASLLSGKMTQPVAAQEKA
ncbi:MULTISPECIES: DMT family transporter [Aquitalea]|uniref:EamA domain-containing membrane protein RarD n=1 Tax=Aquitalea magnusonii TaxID=332411 RepID=A0A318IUJ2_9NEIS|nr:MULTISPECIES: DMT family transporter [Aquitalea]PXX39836.1 EamA domain-containing membrane protein RarD [Aquitalea magnusonii]